MAKGYSPTKQQRRNISKGRRRTPIKDVPEVTMPRGALPHLAGLRAEKAAIQSKEFADGGPYSIYECGNHPEDRVVFGGTLTMVPTELICARCSQRVKPKFREVL